MRILIVTPLMPPEPGGPSYYSVALKDALEQSGQKVDIRAFQAVRKYPSGVRHLLFLYKVLWAARKVDAIIILDTISVALPAVLAGWLLGIKTITRTGGDFVWERHIERTKKKIKLSEFYDKERALSRKERMVVWLQRKLVFRLASFVAFSTEWQRDIWMELYDLQYKKTVIIENACVAQKREQTPDQMQNKTFLWVGRDLVLKNVDMLRVAFEKVKKCYPEYELKILSNVPREEVYVAFKTARCLVLPSISEVSPNLVYEAIAFGVPVLCTDDTGIKKQLSEVVYFINSVDEESLTHAMLAMCDDGQYCMWHDRVAAYRCLRTYDDVAADFLKIIT